MIGEDLLVLHIVIAPRIGLTTRLRHHLNLLILLDSVTPAILTIRIVRLLCTRIILVIDRIADGGLLTRIVYHILAGIAGLLGRHVHGLVDLWLGLDRSNYVNRLPDDDWLSDNFALHNRLLNDWLLNDRLVVNYGLTDDLGRSNYLVVDRTRLCDDVHLRHGNRNWYRLWHENWLCDRLCNWLCDCGGQYGNVRVCLRKSFDHRG